MNGCDTLLMIGTGFPWSEFLPKDGRRARVQIDIDPAMLSLRYPCEVNLHGDAAETLRAAPADAREKTDRSWRATIEERHGGLVEDARGARHDQGASGQSATRGVGDCPRACPTTRSSPATAAPAPTGMRATIGEARADGFASGGLASMGAAVPYAIGAKFAHPDRPVVALVGDGAMQMNNMAELITIAKYWRPLARPAAGRVRLQQRGSERGHLGAAGDERQSALRRQPGYSRRAATHKFAELIGLQGIYRRRSRRPRRAPGTRRCQPTGRSCWRSRPIPKIAPLPPHISFKEAKNFMFAMTRDEDAAHVIARHRASGHQRGAVTRPAAD